MQHVRHERVGSANATATSFIFISRADAAQSRADFLVAETFFASVVQRAMVGKDQMRARTNLYALGRDFDALLSQTISFDEESFRIDHHAVAEYAGLAAMHDT